MLTFHWTSLLAAVLLDYFLGDPEWFPHPVRIIGQLVKFLEWLTRRLLGNLFLAGLVTVAVTVVASGYAAYWLVGYAHSLGFFYGWAVEVLLIYFALSARSLAKAAAEIDEDVKFGRLRQARRRLARIVSRDTGKLGEPEVSRGVIESVAENTVDGIISPLFFLVIGGVPLMWAFKAVSTCDSMVAYRNQRYRYFGMVAAYLDDAANLIPARLVFIVFPLAAKLLDLSWSACLKIAWRDSHHHDSPNAGIPEAGMAGALGVRLGGPTSYQGVLNNKPPFGGEFPPPQRRHIRQAVRMMWFATLLSAFAATIIAARHHLGF